MNDWPRFDRHFVGHDDEGVPFVDGRLCLRDGRWLAWRVWGKLAAPPVVYLQGAVGSRIGRGPDPRRAGVKLVMCDRPGFGWSDPLEARGLVAVADDLADLLDHLGIESAPVLARSAGGPHGLAMAAVHPARVRSLAIVSGAAPVTSEERTHLVEANAALAGILGQGRDALRAYLSEVAARLLTEGTAGVLADAVEVDRRRRRDTSHRDRLIRREALRQGVEGWVDETMAITGEWDFAAADVNVRVDWYHGARDNTIPLEAARRLLARLDDGHMHVEEGRGHLVDVGPILKGLGNGG